MYDRMVENDDLHDGGNASSTSSSENGYDEEFYEDLEIDINTIDDESEEEKLPCRRINIEPHHCLYDHMMCLDRELALFPQRSFSFSGINIIVDQSISDVGHTVWDAEVILAHYISLMRDQIYDKSIVELGAGTGIAGILCAKLGAKTVTLQDQESCISHTQKCSNMNINKDGNDENSNNLMRFVAKKWSKSCGKCLVQANDGHKYDYVIMADVLYHCEDFSVLVETIMECVRESGGEVIICYERRRKDLSDFFNAILNERLVLVNAIQEYSVESRDLPLQQPAVKYYLYHFKARSKPRSYKYQQSNEDI